MNALTFILTSVIIIVLPGTGVVYTISEGLSHGRRAGLEAAFGCTLGILPHLAASTALSSLLMTMSPRAFALMKAAGAAYLLWMAAGMIFSGAGPSFASAAPRMARAQIIRRGILINLLNPKLTLFFFAFLPQYAVSASGSYAAQCLGWGAAFMALTFIVFAGYALLAASAQRFISGSPKRALAVQRLFGCAFAAFAAQLAMSSI